MNPKIIKKNVGLLFPKHCYLINKICYGIQNEIGTIYKEKDYQKLSYVRFLNNKIPTKREVLLELKSKEGISISKFYADFILWNLIVVEFKVADFIKSDYIRQVLRYLETADLPLALIYNFRVRPLKPKRVVNFKCSNIDQHKNV
ncbi:GxxExxY protein [Patescibacteria group bacterium]|nr:GxxExxY protein [Patescibacteria group bacterium]MBU4511881.1 GxxExxY protein [Patescibacteria group bacterium]